MAKELSRIGKVLTALLEHPHGISGREIDFKYYLNSGRNEAGSTLIKQGFRIVVEVVRDNGKHWSNYRLADKKEAYKALKRLNFERQKVGQDYLGTEETHRILERFKGDL